MSFVALIGKNLEVDMMFWRRGRRWLDAMPPLVRLNRLNYFSRKMNTSFLRFFAFFYHCQLVVPNRNTCLLCKKEKPATEVTRN